MSIIQFENVWKKYSLHHQRSKSIKKAFVELVSPFREKQEIDAFWALQGVNFSVSDSESLGIIGSNGSGKSTLLKLAVGISKPNKGKVKVDGRISALLELGAGFHPEFSGRENVFLNGAILGMPRREIARRFDEIVAFAEIEPFIDNPVRTYSTGMYMRLAFAIAVNVDPDILVIDEILAVGDGAFQKKCFEQMLKFKRDGKCILFVSHDMTSMQNFCDRVIWIERGHQMADGPSGEVIELYKAHLASQNEKQNKDGSSGLIEISEGRFLADSEVLVSGERATLEFDYVNKDPQYRPTFQIRINREDGLCCFCGSSDETNLPPRGEASRVILEIERLNLLSGRYFCEIAPQDANGAPCQDALSLPFEVSSDIRGEGIVPLQCRWEFSAIGKPSAALRS